MTKILPEWFLDLSLDFSLVAFPGKKKSLERFEYLLNIATKFFFKRKIPAIVYVK